MQDIPIPEGLDLILLQIIPRGRRNARTGKQLVRIIKQRQLIGLPERDPERIVRRAVQLLRQQGVPVCADTTDGYYLPADLDELETYHKQLAGRAAELWSVYQALRRTVLHWRGYAAGQTSITDPETQTQESPWTHIPPQYRAPLLERLAPTPPQPAQPQPEAQPEAQSAPESPIQALKEKNPALYDILRRAVQDTDPHVKPAWTLDKYVDAVLMRAMQHINQQRLHALPLTYLKQHGISKRELKYALEQHYSARKRAVCSQRRLEV